MKNILWFGAAYIRDLTVIWEALSVYFTVMTYKCQDYLDTWWGTITAGVDNILLKIVGTAILPTGHANK